MHSRVASGTQCDEILFAVISGSAPKPNVVYLEILRAPAQLATPTVPFEHLLMKDLVVFRIKPNPLSFRGESAHEAFLTRSTNCCL